MNILCVFDVFCTMICTGKVHTMQTGKEGRLHRRTGRTRGGRNLLRLSVVCGVFAGMRYAGHCLHVAANDCERPEAVGSLKPHQMLAAALRKCFRHGLQIHCGNYQITIQLCWIGKQNLMLVNELSSNLSLKVISGSFTRLRSFVLVLCLFWANP